jgi:CubicO group peptidase (beta-lactamase class C family)
MDEESEKPDGVEELLRETLGREPQPALSPFFAARVANIARAEEKSSRRRSHPILAVYWGLLLVASIWSVGQSLRSDVAYNLLLALVPAGFALAVYWRQGLEHLGKLMGWLFGQGGQGVAGLFAALTLGLGACGGEPPVPDVPFAGPAAVREYLQAYVDAPGGPPSISLAVAVDGDLVLAEAVGFADIGAQRAATPETPYRTYSISKGITAVAVMQAVERGELHLDDDIREALPAFPEKPWPVRLQHLLTHTSGIRHYKEGAGEISSMVEYPTLADSLPVFAGDPLEFEPGTGYRYTSFGFNLVTGALEGAVQKPFGQILDERVFGPAGMSRSSLAVAARPDPEIAQPYWAPRFGKHREIDDPPNVSGRYGSSGVVSTPADLVKLFLALERGDLMAAETVQQMFTEPDADVAPSQALGWNVGQEEGRRVIYRTGAGTGYTGIVEYLPEQRIVGAVLINQNQYKGRVQILERVLVHYQQAGR